MKNGTRHSYTAKIAKGDPRNPMTEDEVIEKFRGNVKAVLAEDSAQNLITAVQHLESVDNVKNLAKLLTTLK